MSESFKESAGRKVVSRTTAQEAGGVTHFLVDEHKQQILSLVVGRGKKAKLVDWVDVSGFGPDAVMISDETALRVPADDREREAAAGKLELVGKRTLSELGNELGPIEDVTFEVDSGALEDLVVGDRHLPAHSLIATGSYAAVIDKSEDT